jgi:homoserine dehydrogenase
MFVGLGAGRLPTASAVCGDIIDIARNIQHHATGRISCTCFEEKRLAQPENIIPRAISGCMWKINPASWPPSLPCSAPIRSA